MTFLRDRNQTFICIKSFTITRSDERKKKHTQYIFIPWPPAFQEQILTFVQVTKYIHIFGSNNFEADILKNSFYFLLNRGVRHIFFPVDSTETKKNIYSMKLMRVCVTVNFHLCVFFSSLLSGRSYEFSVYSTTGPSCFHAYNQTQAYIHIRNIHIYIYFIRIYTHTRRE